MATYVLIHGAASDSWYWHRVSPELRRRGHEVIAPDLPCEDDRATFSDYADVVADAIGERGGIVLVAQSLGGFTAPLVCDRVPVDLLVLLNAMIPRAGESGAEWWESTGHAKAFAELAQCQGRDPAAPLDLDSVFFHDVPKAVRDEAMANGGKDQSATPMEAPWPGKGWPAVPTRAVVATDDRFFPAPFQRRLARERLGIEPDELEGGHLVALSRPGQLVTLLERIRTEASPA